MVFQRIDVGSKKAVDWSNRPHVAINACSFQRIGRFVSRDLLNEKKLRKLWHFPRGQGAPNTTRGIHGSLSRDLQLNRIKNDLEKFQFE